MDSNYVRGLLIRYSDRVAGMKHYILSSQVFKTKKDILKRLEGWLSSGDLRGGCKVFEVEIKHTYTPKVRKYIVLEEI